MTTTFWGTPRGGDTTGVAQAFWSTVRGGTTDLGPLAETSVAAMSLSGVSFNVTVVKKESAGVTLSLTKPSFNVQAVRKETGVISLGLVRINFNHAGLVAHTATSAFRLNKVSILAYAFDVSAIAKLRIIHSFG